MTVRQIAVDVCSAWRSWSPSSSSVGVLAMRDAYQKLHYVTPVALVAPLFAGLAVLVESGWSEHRADLAGAAVVAIASPFLSHATIRAARIRERATGGWRRNVTAARPVSGLDGGRRSVTALIRPAGLMSVLQVTLLVLVAAGAAGVVLIRAPVRQVIVLSAYGLLLAMLFLAFQAPDVTLSELTVGAVVLPILLLLTLAKVRKREE